MIHVADCAYPTDWHDLPADVQVVLGYVGDPHGTPHVWSTAEIASVHHAGRAWAPIWTPPQPAFTTAEAHHAAAGMITALRALRYDKAGPVFLDIEHGTWSAAPHTVHQAITTWKQDMHTAGWTNAYAYVPAEAEFDWVADWVGTPPQHFAPGVVGVQYAGEVMGGRYDLSVFTPAVFAPLLKPRKAPAVTLTQADKDWVTAQVATPLHQLHLALTRIYGDGDTANPRPFALRHLSEKLDELVHDVTKPRPVTVDYKALASEISATLGVDISSQVVELLATKLGK